MSEQTENEKIADEITRFAFALDGPYKVNIDPHKDLIRFSEVFEKIKEELDSKDSVENACDILWDECVKNKAKEFGEWDCEVDGKKFIIRIQLDTIPSYAELEAEIKRIKQIQIPLEQPLQYQKLTDELATLRAERDRLREALEYVKKLLPQDQETLDHAIAERLHELSHYLLVDIPYAIDEALTPRQEERGK